MPTLNRIREDATIADEALIKLAGGEPVVAPVAVPEPTAAPVAVAVSEPTASPVAVAASEPTAAPVVVAVSEPTPKEPELLSKLAALEQQYQSLQGAYNKQTEDFSETRGRVDTLMQVLAARATEEAPEAKNDPLVTEDEVTEYGADMIDVTRRAAREEWMPLVKALRDELESATTAMSEMQIKVNQASQTSASVGQRTFAQDLNQRAPGWEKINIDPKFIDWLQQPDVYSGLTKLQLLQTAYQNADVERVARFFNDFSEQTGEPAAPAADTTHVSSVDPASLISPSASASPSQSSTPTSGRVWSLKEIDKVYQDKIHGKLSPKKFAGIEAEINQALSEGRITE